jgi:hypothetical protein
MTFETDYSIYHEGEWYDKSRRVLVLPDGTRMENLVSAYDDIPITNSMGGSTGQEFPNTDIYFSNPLIDVNTVRHTSKHYLVARILKQIDDFAFNGAKLKVVPPEDEAQDIAEHEIDEVQAKINAIDNKIVKTITRLRQSAYDEIIYGSAIFERIMGVIEDWKAPVLIKRLPAYSFCDRPIGRMDPQNYVCGDILYGIVFDKKKDVYEYWQKQDSLSNPVQIPTKNVIHIRDEISEQVDGDSFIQKIIPLIKKLEASDMALMETVHRAGAPLLWIKIEEYRDNPLAQSGKGLWSPKKAFDEGKKLAINHGKNNAMVAPSCITPQPLDYTLPINPIDVVQSYEIRILYALIPRDFTEQSGTAISQSGAPNLKLLTLVAEGWREKVSRPFIEMWDKVLEDNGYPGWHIEIEWVDLDAENESELYKRAETAFKMTDTFTQNEIRSIAGWPAKSDKDIAEEEAKKAEEDKKALEQLKLVQGQPGQPGQPGQKPAGTPEKPVDVKIGKVTEGGETAKTKTGEIIKDKQERPIKNDAESWAAWDAAKAAGGGGAGKNYKGFKVNEDFGYGNKISPNIDPLTGEIKDPNLGPALNRAAEPLKTADPDDLKALEAYTSVSFFNINEGLVSGDLTDDAKNKIEKIDNCFKDAALQDDLVAFRGVKDSIIVDNPDLKEALDTPGSVIEMPCYTSSSILPYAAERFVEGYNGRMLEMKLPSGTKALYVPSVSTIAGEFELLVDRGTKFSVGATRKENIRSPNGSVKLVTVTTVEAIK